MSKETQPFDPAQGETPVKQQAPLIGAAEAGRETEGAWDPFIDWTPVFPGNRGVGRDGTYGLFDAPVGIRLAVEVGDIPDPILVSETSWEGKNQIIPIAYWENAGKHHLLYTVYDRSLKVDRSARGLGGVRTCTCYAVSDDAYHWERPDLGLVEFDGSTANNIIPMTLTGTPFRDPTAPAEERFRAMGQEGHNYDPDTGEVLESVEAGKRFAAMETGGRDYKGPRVASKHWITGWTSADGIQWSERGTVADMPSDGGNAAQYDPERDDYFAYIRAGGMGRRAIGYVRTGDFWHWPEPELVLAPDPQDDPEISFYGANYFRYPGRPDLHGFFLHIYHQCTDHMDNQVAFSRDWTHWQRPERRAVVPVGPPGSGDEGIVRVGLTGLQQLPDGCWATLVEGRDQLHNDHEMQKPGQIRWARWHPHRLCGVEAEQEGRFTIPTLTRGRDSLRLNYRCAYGGWIEAELIENIPSRLNPDAPAIPGFSFAESDRLMGDSLDGTMTWNGNPHLTAAGETIAIRLRMFQAKVFAYAV